MPSRAPKLSKTERKIINIILANPVECTGRELFRLAAGELQIGTIYTTLQRMERKGFLASVVEERRPSVPGNLRRFYSVTSLGLRTCDIAMF
jgi:predicted transcriptional regulator